MFKSSTHQEEDFDDLPPPYTASEAGPSSSGTTSLTSHLQSLRNQANIARDVDDNHLLACISDSIENLLTSVLASKEPGSLVSIEAFVVPAGALGPKWELSDTEDRHSSKVARVVRVDTRGKKGTGDKKQSESTRGSSVSDSLNKGFDEWGRWSDDEDAFDGASEAPRRRKLWWYDDALARRLARYLQPAQPPSVTASVASSSRAASRMSEAVSMNVRAEEATFRGENEMGLWESKTGWAIVVRFRL